MKRNLLLILTIIFLTVGAFAQQTATVKTAAEIKKEKEDLAEYFLKACAGGFSSETGFSHGSPTYSSPKAKEIVEKMIAAHGGMAKWNSSQALSFTHLLVFGKPLETEFWLSTETTEIKTERAYHDWHTFDGKLAFDGSKIWTQNWKLDNPPGTNVNNIYHAMALPWLTQSSDAILEEQPQEKIGESPILYDVVKMTSKKDGKAAEYKYYKLFIDPKTHLLTGIGFNITYGAFLDLIGLPKEMKSLGPFTHVVYTYQKVDGLTFPEKYDTFDPLNHNSGRHIVYNYSLNKKFDESRMKMPVDAVLDTNKSERKTVN